MFQRAEKKIAVPKIGFSGPSGSGKTYSALRFATGYVGKNGKVAFIDTENGSASLYADKFRFDVEEIVPRSQTYNGDEIFEFYSLDFLKAIRCACDCHYDFIIIDSFSHLWQGILSFKNRLDERSKSNLFANWGEAGANYQTVLDTILQAQVPIACCVRSKTEYVLEKSDSGATVPKKVGLAPIARDGIDYEFSVFFEIERNHYATAGKDRTGLFEARRIIDETTGESFRSWFSSNGSELQNNKNNNDLEKPIY